MKNVSSGIKNPILLEYFALEDFKNLGFCIIKHNLKIYNTRKFQDLGFLFSARTRVLKEQSGLTAVDCLEWTN